MKELLNPDMSKTVHSSLGIKYPTFRDHPLKSGAKWLEGKRIDDGAEGFWRIHDNLYDLANFSKFHPGGKDWIELTQGIDITEAFESHHLTDEPRTLLEKYYLRKASKPRNYPFTFKENGFYKTLKKRISEKLESIPQDGRRRSEILTDTLFVSYISFFLLAVYFKSFIFGMVSGVSLGMTAIAAHNFFHQKDNFRRFYFDFSMMSSREWRISHALSHHLYTNTIHDLEISMVEPFFQYLPGKKLFIFKYGSWLYSPVLYALILLQQYLKIIAQCIADGGKSLSFTLLLPFVPPLLGWYLTKESLIFLAIMFAWMIVVASTHFGVVGVNAAHHHPDIFHDGDACRPHEELDWGIHQMDAVMDRKDITGSHFLVLTNFGDHALHHLFPTIDHGLLEHLYPTFVKTCQEFGIEWRMTSQIELIKGQFKQLMKVKGNESPPKKLLKTG